MIKRPLPQTYAITHALHAYISDAGLATANVRKHASNVLPGPSMRGSVRVRTHLMSRRGVGTLVPRLGH